MTTAPGAAAEGADPAEHVAAAVLTVAGVAGLHGGTFGTVATYLPGRSVRGVRIGPGGVEVHVTLLREAPVPATADAVRAAAAAVVPGPVHVYVEDLVAARTGDL